MKLSIDIFFIICPLNKLMYTNVNGIRKLSNLWEWRHLNIMSRGQYNIANK